MVFELCDRTRRRTYTFVGTANNEDDSVLWLIHTADENRLDRLVASSRRCKLGITQVSDVVCEATAAPSPPPPHPTGGLYGQPLEREDGGFSSVVGRRLCRSLCVLSISLTDQLGDRVDPRVLPPQLSAAKRKRCVTQTYLAVLLR